LPNIVRVVSVVPTSESVQTISFWRGVLPHWEVVDGRYFVTLRLANSLPHRVAEDLATILKDASEQNYLKRSRRYFRELEHWLAANHGELHLEDEAIATMIMDGIAHYEQLGYWHVSAAVVMPNHLHALLHCETLGLSQVMKRFKQYTAREANRKLDRKGKRFWQREWFDHWSRSAQEDDRIISYIRNNPVRAGLVKRPEDWQWSQ
jgi:REP element-mobilizing transposase RayT